ncbi:metal ABC transporter ATP-binding protein [Oscillatoria sp. CS-180]|uniref:metal ABC transporter ATP-binding protein n=1 Tax=Oscillatoria sp. CS-180 TaxID=3021720 RepID=UPI002330BEB3|nr:metal ABC transporter ATP-binding protein [Oscillatoria sp. CS-180]MDB9526296.1 metal ABC transporter ATP-binding protein [Oscillatoria sp. CS-180]
MLTVQNLSVNYRGIEALTGVSMALRPGEWVGLIGPNGAGKSTLVKAILGLTPYRGKILLNGASLKRQRSQVAYVPQRSQIDWDYPITAWNVVMMAQTRALGWGRSPGSKVKELVSASLDRVEMLPLKNRPIGQLSGGQQQRVFLARALAQQPNLFLLDEPFSGIDKKTEAIMLSIFADLSQQGKTLLVCSHEWGEALNRYDRLLLLNRRVLADDAPQAVMTMENIQQAYGTNVQADLHSQTGAPFVY